MYQSSPSTSSSQKSTVAAGGSGGLIRYGSAPGSLLASAVDSVIGSASREEFSALGSNLLRHHQYFSADSSSSSSSKSESICKVSSSYDPKATSLQRSYGFNEISLQSNGGSAGTESSYSLARQRSSPAGFFSHLLADQNGFSITRGNDNYSPQGCSSVGRGASRLKTQLSFTGQDTLAQISEGNECILNGDMGLGSGSQSYNAASSSFAGMDLWEASNSIGFTTTQPNKRAKNVDGDFFAHLDSLENQFSVSQTSLEMGGGDSFLHLPEDTVPCKMRAKRGFATHPRSIAERERRTRISGKLKKLQELVPNMDKQTSYSDMLDLAVQHIKGLQNQVQKLQKEQENCTCGCKQSS